MTTNYFGRYIGLARSENLYQIKAGKNGISQNLARRIVEKFPELSVGWLLTGEGDMFSKGSTNGRIPFFDCDVVGRGLLRLDEIKPDYRMNIPTIEDCDYAFRSYDVAMSNEIAVGSILFLKKTAVFRGKSRRPGFCRSRYACQCLILHHKNQFINLQNYKCYENYEMQSTQSCKPISDKHTSRSGACDCTDACSRWVT